MSVYATLTPETGRSSELRIVRCEEKKESLYLPLWNISTPGSSGVMGVKACLKVVSISYLGQPEPVSSAYHDRELNMHTHRPTEELLGDSLIVYLG